MPHDDEIILDIVSAARDIVEAVSDRSIDDFLDDWLVNAAVTQRLLVIGEACKQLSPEFRMAHPEVDWGVLARTRDKLIHHYRRVDLQEVWEIASQDVPHLISSLEPLAPRAENDP